MNRTGDDGGGWTAISIRRDGNRPLRFVGRLIDAFDDQRSALPASFRLLLYKIQFGGYVILIDARIGHSDGDVIEKRDQIFLASKIEEICTFVENFDPVGLLAFNLKTDSVSERSVSSASFKFLNLFHDIKLSYGYAVGQLLSGLAWADL